MKVVALSSNTNVLTLSTIYDYGTMNSKCTKALLRRNKMIDVMGNSSENLITLCKCKVLLLCYILMQISESVIGIHSKE